MHHIYHPVYHRIFMKRCEKMLFEFTFSSFYSILFPVLSTLFYFFSWYVIKRREEREAAENLHSNSVIEFTSPVPGIIGREEVTDRRTPTPSNGPISPEGEGDLQLTPRFAGLNWSPAGNSLTQHETSI